MSRRLNVSQTLAMKAAAAAAAADEVPESATAPVVPAALELEEGDAKQRARGRPRGKRPVAARQTVYLDERRHAALSRLADDRGRSVHSLILEGIDHVIGKPVKPGWE